MAERGTLQFYSDGVCMAIVELPDVGKATNAPFSLEIETAAVTLRQQYAEDKPYAIYLTIRSRAGEYKTFE